MADEISLEEVDDYICSLAEKGAGTPSPESKRTREDRVAICRWVLRSLVYKKDKIKILKKLNRL